MKIRFVLYFLALYLVVGITHQFIHMNDIYPFTDWYLYSFVNESGEIYDIKYLSPKNEAVYLFDVNHPLGEELAMIADFYRSGHRETAHKLLQDITNKYKLTGTVSLVVNKAERFDFYNHGNRKNEEIIFSLEGQ